MGNKKSEVKADKIEKPAEPPSAKPKKPSEEDVLEIMRRLSENGIAEFNSRLISDKLGLEPDAGRQKVRILMKKLEKAGKVVVENKAAKGARKRYVYGLKQR